MGLFNRISTSDSLEKALKKKRGNDTLSDKTVKKLTEKIQSASRDARLVGYNQVLIDGKYSKVQDKIKDVFRDALLNDSLDFIGKQIDNNLQPDLDTNFIDEIYLPLIIDSIRKKRQGANLYYFDDLNYLFSKALAGQIGNRAQAVVHMRKKADISQPHFSAVEYIKDKGKDFFIFYEPAHLSGGNEAGVDYGFNRLNEIFKVLSKRYSNLRVGFVEVGIQSSEADCGIFSLAFANTLSKLPHISQFAIGKLVYPTITQFYHVNSNARKERHKIGVSLEPTLIKHAHSINKLRLNIERNNGMDKDLKQEVYNRATKYAVTRDERTYSNSIELKRQAFFNKHLKSRLDN